MYVRVDGDWEADYPNIAPPAPKVERVAVRPGQIWVPGHWYWKNGRWDWYPGRAETRRPGKRYREVTWELKNGIYVRVGGDWVDHDERPRQPPPAWRDDTPRNQRRGWVWVAGHWEWDDGQYEWVPGKLVPRPRNKRWQEGRWEQRNNEWTWTAGVFVDAPKEQGAPPPPPAEDPGRERKGYLWVKGHWEWRDGDYEWVPGHWERMRAGKTWTEGRWDNTSGKWTWVPGHW